MLNDVGTLLSPVEAAKIHLENRLVAQPMERGFARGVDGAVSTGLVDDYVQLARGGWGLVIIEAMSVDPRWKSRPKQLVISEKTKKGLAGLVSAMKATAPGIKTIFQLTFPGSVTSSGLQKSTVIPAIHEQDPSVHFLDDGELEGIAGSFMTAIDISIECGADGIDVKACHGYLGVELLRPSNDRQGPWGGEFENRARLLLSAISHAKGRVDEGGIEGLMIGSRVSVYEAIPGGFGTGGPQEVIEDLAEPVRLARMMNEAGANYINVTAGIPAKMPEITRPSKTVPFGIYNHFRHAKVLKASLSSMARDMLVIGSGYSMLGKQLVPAASKNVLDGNVDLVGIGRQILADPLYPAKIGGNSEGDVRWCVGCNQCAKLLVSNKHVGCAYHDETFKSLASERV